jgi:hypothetical protein
MNKDDKAFISGLFNSLEGKITGVEGKITGLDGRITSLEDKVNYNGILMERQSDLMYAIGENVTTLNDRLDRVETKVDQIDQNTNDMPFIRKMVKKHDKQLAALEK